MKTITGIAGKIMLAFVLVLCTMACGGDDTSSGGNEGGGGNKPSGNSGVGAWYTQSGNYFLVWDFANTSSVTLHMYEIYGNIYYKTQGTGTYSKNGNVISLTIGGETATATIVDDVMHMNDATMGNFQLKKVTTSVQSSINTMENYFDNLQKQVVNEWYIYNDYYNDYEVIKFESSGKGSTVTYTTYNTSPGVSFTWTRGGLMTLTNNDGSKQQLKFNIKGGVLNILSTYQGTEQTISFQLMTDEIRQKIEDLRKAPTLQNGIYVEKNPEMKEYFMAEVDGNDIEEFVITYGKKKKVIDGRFSISGNQMTIEGADVNGDGVVDSNDKVSITVNGDELKVGNITFVRVEVTKEKMIGLWQSTRSILAYYDDAHEKCLNTWDEKGAQVRIQLNNNDTFQTWNIESGSWKEVQKGTFSYSDSKWPTITTYWVEEGKNYSDNLKIIYVNDTQSILEYENGKVYSAYYMTKQ